MASSRQRANGLAAYSQVLVPQCQVMTLLPGRKKLEGKSSVEEKGKKPACGVFPGD